MSLIYGDKTVLRRFEDRMSDAEVARVYRWSRDPELLRWSGGSPIELSLPEFHEHLRGERLYGPGNRRAFLIFDRETMQLIGRLGIFAIDWDRRDGELGIVLGERAYWGHGYGRDAVRAILRHIFSSSSLRSIYLYTFSENLRAQRAFSAVGFRVVEHVRRFMPDTGEFEGVKMQITRQEFLERDLARQAERLEIRD